MGLLDLLTEPLTYGFMQRGLAAAMIVGLVCAVIGCYVVLRGMAFLGDAMAHAILPGVALAYLWGANLLLGAAVAAVVVAVLIGLVSRQGRVKEDTAIGILFAAALSLGVALISSGGSYAMDLSHILFGHVLGVSAADLRLIALLGLAVVATVLLLYKELLVVSFDPVLATTLRLPVERLRMALLLLLALTVVASLPAVGVGLVAAMLVTPPATAYLLTRRLPAMMLLAALLGAASGLVGLYLSYYADIASGAAVVLTATAFFGLAYLFNPRDGVLRGRGPAAAVVALALAAGAIALGQTMGPPAPVSAADVGPPRILAQDSVLADIVRQVAGDQARVEAFVPAGMDGHSFEPRPADLRRLEEARLVVVYSAEDPVGALLAEGRAGTTISAGPDEEDGHDDEHRHGLAAHLWLDPIWVQGLAGRLADGLTRSDPDGAAGYAANTARFREALAALDLEIAGLVAGVPPERRVLVTEHESLGPFAARYGLRVVGSLLGGASSEASPSARRLAALADTVRRLGAPALLLEAGADARLAEQVAADSGVRVVTGLHTESLTGPGGPAPDYLAMMRHDARLIAGALKASEEDE